MDEIDIRLSRLLMENSRQPYRELARKLDISLQAVHRRIQNLQQKDVIRSFCISFSPNYIGYHPVSIFGKSESKVPSETIDKLGRDERVSNIYVAGGGMLYVVGALRDLSEIDDFTGFVRDTAKIDDPQVGIINTGPQCEPPHNMKDDPLSPLDARILASLSDDSRKPASDVAEEVGVTSKTVNKRLKRLVDSGLLRFTVEWFPRNPGNLVSIIHLDLKKGTNKHEVGQALIEKFEPWVLTYYLFLNMPDFIVIFAVSPTAEDLARLHNDIAKDPSVETVTPHILYTSEIFDTWMNELPGLSKTG
jgi:DNA-binding Lrp family transcriptional regulator